MTISLYAISVPIFIRHLKGLAIVTRKAQALYAEKKLDEATKHPSTDTLAVADLKRRKLLLKDEITRLRGVTVH